MNRPDQYPKTRSTGNNIQGAVFFSIDTNMCLQYNKKKNRQVKFNRAVKKALIFLDN